MKARGLARLMPHGSARPRIGLPAGIGYPEWVHPGRGIARLGLSDGIGYPGRGISQLG